MASARGRRAQEPGQPSSASLLGASALLLGAGLGGVLGCASEPATTPSPDAAVDAGAAADAGGPAVTFFRDVKPIIDARCVACHQAGSIGPFELTDPETVADLAPVIKNQIDNGLMPPWPPSEDCRTYRHDRSLDEAERATLDAWFAEGAPLGDPSTEGPPLPSAVGGLSRVDLELQVPEPYTPEGRDDYHCFVIPWPGDGTRFVTGFGLEPGNPALVHHANMYLTTPLGAGRYTARQEAAPGPGFPCFGGIVDPEVSLMGAWAPGSIGLEYPEGTGIQVDPGSALVLEMHFDTSSGGTGPDQSTVLVQTAPEVARRAAILPLIDFDWPSGQMPIPAGASSVRHEVQLEGLVLQEAVRFLAPWLAGQPLAIHGAGLHMHYLGARGRMEVGRFASSECVIDIPRWDFDWQSGYILEDSIPFDPTRDSIRLACEFDNSADNQPVIDGAQRAPADVNWGTSSQDEMCIGYLYVTTR